MKTLTISLSPQQVLRLQGAVKSGAYASNSEVVRDALRLWEEREEKKRLEVKLLRKAYEDGIASGEPREIDPTAFLAELKAAFDKT
ncbi:type II toxin-antitoxin system ParD family antitoxin [Rhizobium sp. NRK18]|uniref:type II toxin-antitoxin system ParD family antitoxin n=1 Tax=Rhizobium sp. NRK18 TaxID=2964667 RepID=UPI0021C37A71|nr:type II toxin-antitoxin system ParD family antitoxin [Rhizobium sp. NRK18]MCQ2003972.1 type II toxin-antitoxin system ParD family antitoxin [Rhizobium sp. NRK18]